MNSQYIFSKKLEIFASLAVKRMQNGRGAVLLLTGIPGSGKTQFAYAVAAQLGAEVFKYQCAPDKERNLLYDIDVDGVLQKTGAWLSGPAWQAFEASQNGFAVLLIDEVDKTHQNFDAFLLELLEEFRFRSPNNGYIQANPANLLVILTSNGRRELRPETQRRAQRIPVDFPETDRLEEIIHQLVGEWIPAKLLEQVIRFAGEIRKVDPELAPSPKEMALFIVDALALVRAEVWEVEIWREVCASYFIKGTDGASAIDRILKFNWAKAFITDLQKEIGR